MFVGDRDARRVAQLPVELHGIPRWAHESLARDLLGRLWDRYSERPVPRRTKLSDAQMDAEVAAGRMLEVNCDEQGIQE